MRILADNQELVNWVRLVKSENEIRYMREAGKISTGVMKRAIELLKPGYSAK